MFESTFGIDGRAAAGGVAAVISRAWSDACVKDRRESSAPPGRKIPHIRVNEYKGSVERLTERRAEGYRSDLVPVFPWPPLPKPAS